MEIGPTLRFKRNLLNAGAIDGIKRSLMLKQKGGEKFGFGPGQTISLYREFADQIEVPRQWGMRNIIADFPMEGLGDNTVEGEPVKFNFTKPLRPEQAPLVADFLSKIGKGSAKYGGIFSAPCGMGKTVMSLKFLSELGRPALIFVHTSFLLKQWRESIAKFTDIPANEVGLIKQDVCEWEGKKVVIAMVESLCAREYDPRMYRHFGIIVADEVHRHGAAEWNRAVPMFPARLRIGLSATPRRGDGLWDIIRWHIGEVLTQGTGGGKAKVFCLPTGVNVPSDSYYVRGEINLGKLVTILAEIEDRNHLISGELVKAVKAGRRVLVLSDRIKHLDTLDRMFREKWVANYEPEVKAAHVLMGEHPFEGVDIGRYVGGIKDAEIERNRTCNLLFGTMQYAKEGLDDPGMDTLFLVSPKSDIEQPCGRILRELEGKKTPFVIDFVDEGTGPCVGFAKSRRKQYARLGFEVHDPSLTS